MSNKQPRAAARADPDLCWRVDEACMNAWPCARQLLWWPWLLRAQGGTVRRVNSLNPLRAERHAVEPLLAPAAALYARRGQPLIIRVPSIARGVDEALDRHGFGRAGETCTLFAAQPRATADAAVTLGAYAGADWLDARRTLSAADATQQQIFLQMLDALALPVAFAALRIDGRIVSIAYGAVHAGLLVLEAVATLPAQRNRGYGRRVVASLLAWGAAHGAPCACLQVVADNAPALALYRALGFDRELYRYGYRQPPSGR